MTRSDTLLFHSDDDDDDYDYGGCGGDGDDGTLAGQPSYMLVRLEWLMNAAACLVCSATKYNHVTSLLNAPWLRVTQRIEFTIAVYLYIGLSMHAWNMWETFIHVRQRMWCRLFQIPIMHLSTVGDRSFQIPAGTHCLPTSCRRLSSFERQLTIELFRRSLYWILECSNLNHMQFV